MGTKAERMKIFVAAKIYLASIDLDENKRVFHLNQVLHVVQGFSAIVLQCLYLVLEANTVLEYMNSTLMSGIGIIVYIGYWTTIFKTMDIYNFINRLEIVINESEF